MFYLQVTCLITAAVWTVGDVARLIEIKKNSYLFIYLFIIFYPR